MANHKSSIKRIRQTETRNERNRYQHKTLRSAMKKFMALSDKVEAGKQLPNIASMLDRLAKKSVIHKNKAANLKSELNLHVNHIK
ncbi:MAG: 30S ribosomal protein S20 [Bacteroidetes bacterium]|jgi:small subunit ribosomal protein S20|nr:30S ribosomal protein S20 [Bacteroidota bacterium]